MIRRRHGAVAVFLSISVLAASQAFAHCQIPCGIYGDELRVQLLAEHVTTIEKSMNQIVELGKASPVDYNQLVRWVSNKEEHAQKIQDIVTAYFMAQRIKAPAETEGEAHEAYLRNLELLHRMQVAAMKAKQSTDLEQVDTLRTLLKKFQKSYFGDEH